VALLNFMMDAVNWLLLLFERSAKLTGVYRRGTEQPWLGAALFAALLPAFTHIFVLTPKLRPENLDGRALSANYLHMKKPRWTNLRRCATLSFLVLPLLLRAQDQPVPLTVSHQAASSTNREYLFTPGSARDLVKDGVWLRDRQSRYVLLRGVNFAPRAKLTPYIPIMPLHTTTLDHAQFEAELQAVQPQLQELRSMGMNVVRMPIMWKALEPTPNPDLDTLEPEGVTYLGYVKQIIDSLYAQGIYTIVDFHQDIAHEAFGGDGFPDWTLDIKNKHPGPVVLHSLPNMRWGTNYYDVPWWGRIICHCASRRSLVRKTLRSFWLNGDTNPSDQAKSDQLAKTDASGTNIQDAADLTRHPQTHYIKTVGQVVKYFEALNDGAGDPGVIGYEPFNEPTQVGFKKQEFEREMLPRFYERVEQEIAKYDTRSLIFLEPRVDWTVYEPGGGEFHGASFTLKPKSFLPAPFKMVVPNGGVFSFHYYDPWLSGGVPFGGSMYTKAKTWPAVFQQMHDEAVSRDLVPFLTEFGCSQNWKGVTSLKPDVYRHSVVRACMDLQFQQVEAQLLNATYWNFDLYNREKTLDNWNMEDLSLLGPKRIPRNADIVTRPYPMRSSAMPERVLFDLDSKNAAFVLKGPVSDAPTVIFVPRLHYAGNQFEVRTTSVASSVEWDEANQLLYWYPDKSRTENQLILSLPGGFDTRVLPPESKALLPQTTHVLIVTHGKREAVEFSH
jgi:aryl-phospho-beta-D-glucosidase BglC (GH1 family)